jgi:low affinity Fe/Cu permease
VLKLVKTASYVLILLEHARSNDFAFNDYIDIAGRNLYIFTFENGVYMNEIFRRFSQRASEIVGSPWAFLIAAITVMLWAVTGPIFNFSDTWQLVINTGTTIITFLMVFLIQNTQNRDAKAMHLKLDELIRSNAKARNALIDLEDLDDQQIEEIQKTFQNLHQSESPKVRKFAKKLQNKLDTKKKP